MHEPRGVGEGRFEEPRIPEEGRFAEYCFLGERQPVESSIVGELGLGEGGTALEIPVSEVRRRSPEKVAWSKSA